MKKSRSLLKNLILRISAISLISALLLFAISYSQIDRTLDELRDQNVEAQAKDILAHIQENKGRNKILLNLPIEIRRLYARAGDTYQYIVRNGNGNRLFTSPIAFADYFPNDLVSLKEDTPFQFKGPSGRQFIGLTLITNASGEKLYIQVAQSQDVTATFSDEVLDDLVKRLLLFGIPFYLCLILAIIVTLRHGLHPLRDAAKDVSEVGISNLQLRLDEKKAPWEVLPLIRGINFAFMRLEKAITEQQEFTENIAHELRTPLTILKTRMDMIEKNEDTLKVSSTIDDMIKMVNQMLDMTRLEYADLLEKEDVDLAEVLSRACQDFFPLFIAAQKDLRVKGIDHKAIIHGNKDIIYRAICNLLDNALTYGPAKTPVDVALEEFSIKVKDYGRKIPKAQEENIFSRYKRESSVNPYKTGTGLGLSIVNKTMELHGGYMTLDTSGDIGNIFTMHFIPNLNHLNPQSSIST